MSFVPISNKSKTPYVQVTVERPSQSGTYWIPKKFAVVGKVLRFKTDHGHWSNGWEVTHVWPHERPEWQLPDPPREVRAHRKRTGDSKKK